MLRQFAAVKVIAVVGVVGSVAAAAVVPSGLRVSPAKRVSGSSPYPASCPSDPKFGVAGVEFSLAADPARPRRLVGAWIQSPPRSVTVGSSSDGGRGWRLVVPPRLATCTGGAYLRSVDPWLSVGPDGVAYLSTLPVTGGGEGVAAVQVSRSADGGRTWSGPAFVDRRTDAVQTDDKPTVAADPFRARAAYVNWERLHIQRTAAATFLPFWVDFSRTRDGGRSWSPPTTIDRPPVGWTDDVSQVLVPGRGVLLCVFSRVELASNHVFPLPGGRVLLLAKRSLDGGHSWSRSVQIGTGRNFFLTDAERSTPIRSAETVLVTAATGPGARVYATWADVGGRNTSRILLSASRDAGRTWSRPRSASRGARRPMLPTVAVAPNGALALTFYDLRPARPGGAALPTRAWIRYSRDAGRQWQERPLGGVFDLRTAPVATGFTPGRFLGDYEGLVPLPNGFGALFAQARPQARVGSTDGFFARLTPAGLR